MKKKLSTMQNFAAVTRFAAYDEVKIKDEKIIGKRLKK